MMKNAKAPIGRIVSAIALVLKTIAKEDAHSRSRRELGTLNGWKKHKTDTTKSPQMTIERGIRTKTLKRGDSGKNNRRSTVDEVDRGHNSFSPEMSRD